MSALPASTDSPEPRRTKTSAAADVSVVAAQPERGTRESRRALKSPYINRELSWLDYAGRVLYEARDPRNAVLDRVNFLTIFASMLDEFFQIRVSGLRQQLHAGSTTKSPDGRTAGEQLIAARKRVLQLVADQASAWADVRKDLAAEGIEIVKYGAITEHHDLLRQRFIDEIYPVLTPLAVDPGHPFPYISTLSLSIAVGLRDPETNERHFARVKVPQILPRLYPVEPNRFVLIDSIIGANLDLLFSGMEIVEHHLFRVTRNADLSIEEDEADDLLLAIEEELRRRRFGEAVRLEVERSMPHETRAILLAGLGLGDDDAYEVRGMLDLTGLRDLVELDRPDLKGEPWTPVTPARLVPPDEDEPADVFSAIRVGDLLVHHPYESFAASTERFIGQAVDDPEVLTIKMTLYRTSGDSTIVRDLIRAAERGKQVVVLVEIKARFDEEANIVWARKLEQAGAHVVYGLVGLKTHSKVCLVVRREGSGLRRYVHIGTGNYNHRTARLYTDLGLLSCRPELGADVTDLFNVLTGLSRQRSFRRLLVAPHSVRSRFLELVDREIEHAAARPRGPDRREAQRDRGPAVDRGPLPGVAGRRHGRGHRPRRVLPAAGREGRLGARPGPVDRRRVPRALADLGLRQRRRHRLVHRLGRPDGSQPRSAGRGDGPGRGSRGPRAAGGDLRGHARRRPPLLAARPGRDLEADRGDHRRPRHLRHPPGAEGAGPRRSGDRGHPAPAAGRRRLPRPAGLTMRVSVRA